MGKNKVIAGDYKGQRVAREYGYFGPVAILGRGFGPAIRLEKEVVDNYTLVDEDKRRDAVEAVGRGLLGSMVLGAPGLLAGIGARSKGTYTLAVAFKDGKQSLVELDKDMYSKLIKQLF